MPRKNYTRNRPRPKRSKFDPPVFEALLAELQRLRYRPTERNYR